MCVTDSVMATRLACLRCAKAEGNGSNEDLEALEVIFHSSMHHSEEEVWRERSLSTTTLNQDLHKNTLPLSVLDQHVWSLHGV